MRGAGKAAGGIHGSRVTAAGRVNGAVAQGQGQPHRPGGGVGKGLGGSVKIVVAPVVKTVSVENVPAMVVGF